MDDEHAECSKTLRNLVESRCAVDRGKSADLRVGRIFGWNSKKV